MLISKGSASSVTDVSPSASRARIARRVGSASAENVALSGSGDMGMSGVFHAIEAPARLVNTEIFDQDWTGGETLVTTTFVEQNGRTIVAATVRYSSPAARDGALKTPMLEGWSQSHDRLDDLLASADARSSR